MEVAPVRPSAERAAFVLFCVGGRPPIRIVSTRILFFLWHFEIDRLFLRTTPTAPLWSDGISAVGGGRYAWYGRAKRVNANYVNYLCVILFS